MGMKVNWLGSKLGNTGKLAIVIIHYLGSIYCIQQPATRLPCVVTRVRNFENQNPKCTTQLFINAPPTTSLQVAETNAIGNTKLSFLMNEIDTTEAIQFVSATCERDLRPELDGSSFSRDLKAPGDGLRRPS